MPHHVSNKKNDPLLAQKSPGIIPIKNIGNHRNRISVVIFENNHRMQYFSPITIN